MRPSCPYCALKHLAQATILWSEANQGYSQHKWLALGHLAEASDELAALIPSLAEAIRAERKRLETLDLPDPNPGLTAQHLVEGFIPMVDAYLRQQAVDAQAELDAIARMDLPALLQTPAEPLDRPEPEDDPVKAVHARQAIAGQLVAPRQPVVAQPPSPPVLAEIPPDTPAPKGCASCAEKARRRMEK